MRGGLSSAAWLARLCGWLFPAVIPPLHIAVLSVFWKQYNRVVNTSNCTCDCWDTVFKGTYERGVASYKHMYFNATSNTCYIWLITVAAVISLYESVRYLVTLAIDRQLRYSMAMLFASVIFSHYYSWWMYVNYWNDEFYSQWSHQLFFSITEFISTLAVMRLADRKTEVSLNGVIPIVAIATVHILAASKDQFVENVLEGQGSAHQVIRDLAFMLPDILHVSVPLSLIFCSSPNSSPKRLLPQERREFGLRIAACITLGLIIYSLL